MELTRVLRHLIGSSSAAPLVALFAFQSAAQVSLAPPLPFRPSGTGGAVVAADFNGDGKPDLALLETDNTATAAGAVYLGKGDGTFQPGKPFGSMSAGVLVVGDFNGDGRPDLAIASLTSGTVAIFFGSGDGTFQLAGSFAGPAPFTAMCAADWNGDRKTDLAILSQTTATVAILLSGGDGSFQMAAGYPVLGGSGNNCVAADLNGDGKPDLAIVSGILLGPSSTGFVSVLLGSGDGTFQSVKPLAVVVGTRGLAVGDLNLDGKPDIAVTGAGGFPYYNSVIQVLLGAGDGTLSSVFSTPDPFRQTGISYSAITVADLSGDGKPDLVVRLNAGIGFLAGHGDGTFEDAISLVTAAGAGLVTADFNGDGKVDIATSDTVYLNTTPSIGAHTNTGGIVNAAGFQSQALAPGSLISIYGNGLSLTQPPAVSTMPPDFLLNGTEIDLNQHHTPLLYVSPTQINAQVPWELAGQAQASLAISVSGVPGQTVTVPVAGYSPGIFTLDTAAHGAVLIAAPGVVIAASTGSLPGARPVNRGEYIQIFGTGFGPVTRQPPTGYASPYVQFSETTEKPSVDLGGVAALITFSGLAPGVVGVYQINALVPDNAPTGDSVPLKATIRGFESNTVVIAVR